MSGVQCARADVPPCRVARLLVRRLQVGELRIVKHDDTVSVPAEDERREHRDTRSGSRGRRLSGADTGEGDALRIGDLALDGQLGALADELQRLTPGGSEVVPIVRSLQRRVLQLAPLRARIESGERLDAVMTSMGKALFWKDKALMQRLLSQWSAARLAQLAERVSALERRLMLSPVPGDAALGQELLAIARAARR